MSEFLAYEEVESLKKGDHVKFRSDFFSGVPTWFTGTVVSKGTLLGSPSLWIQPDGSYDGKQVQLNVITGTNLKKEYWQQSSHSTQFKFAPLLNYERLEEMHKERIINGI